MNRVGRPKKWNARTEEVKTKLSKTELDKFNYLKEVKCLNTAEIIREAIELYYEFNKYC